MVEPSPGLQIRCRCVRAKPSEGAPHPCCPVGLPDVDVTARAGRRVYIAGRLNRQRRPFVGSGRRSCCPHPNQECGDQGRGGQAQSLCGASLRGTRVPAGTCTIPARAPLGRSFARTPPTAGHQRHLSFARSGAAGLWAEPLAGELALAATGCDVACSSLQPHSGARQSAYVRTCSEISARRDGPCFRMPLG